MNWAALWPHIWPGWDSVWPNILASILCGSAVWAWAHRHIKKLHLRHDQHEELLRRLIDQTGGEP